MSGSDAETSSLPAATAAASPGEPADPTEAAGSEGHTAVGERAGDNHAIQPSLHLVRQRELDSIDPDMWHSQAAHILSARTICSILRTDIDNGLSTEEAARRLAEDGPNEAARTKKRRGGNLFFRLLYIGLSHLCQQAANGMTAVLFVAGMIAHGTASSFEGNMLFTLVGMNIFMGSTGDLSAFHTRPVIHSQPRPLLCEVIRNSRTSLMTSRGVVRGDIVVLERGTIVPADMRLIDSVNLRASEVVLTGDLYLVIKDADVIYSRLDRPSPAARANMVYANTTIMDGRGRGVVTAIGTVTEFGRLLGKTEAEMERPVRIDEDVKPWRMFVRYIAPWKDNSSNSSVRKLGWILLLSAAFLAMIAAVAAGMRMTWGLLHFFVYICIAIIPESLITVSAIGGLVIIVNLRRINVSISDLSALDIIGSVTDVCFGRMSDLTQGTLMARKIWLENGSELTVSYLTEAIDPTDGEITRNTTKPNPVDLMRFLVAVTLNNNSILTFDEGCWSAVGEPVEIALEVLATRCRMGRVRVLDDGGYRFVAEYPFDPATGLTTVVYTRPDWPRHVAYTRGPVEALLPRLLMDEAGRDSVRRAAGRFADCFQLHVICFARKLAEPAALASREGAEKDMKFLGLVGIENPLKRDCQRIILELQAAGLAVRMFTDDPVKKATRNAIVAGIIAPDLVPEGIPRLVMEGPKFESLTDTQVDELPQLPVVLASCGGRVRTRMMEALNRRGATSLLMGRTVADREAMRRAAVSVACDEEEPGMSPNEVQVVLRDCNLGSIVRFVMMGRQYSINFHKYVMFLLVSDLGQVLLFMLMIPFGDGSGDLIWPLAPFAVLWINLFTAMLLAGALAMEPLETKASERPQRSVGDLLMPDNIADKAVYGSTMGLLCIAVFCIVAKDRLEIGHGVTFNSDSKFDSVCPCLLRARAATLAAMTWLHIITAYVVRDHHGAEVNWSWEWFTGKMYSPLMAREGNALFLASLFVFAAHFPIIHLGASGGWFFEHMPLTWEWGLVGASSIVYLVVIEGWKATKRSRKRKGGAGMSPRHG